MEFPLKKPNNSRRYCCVPGCKSLAKKRRDLVFHNFPSENEKRVVTVITSSGNKVSLLRRKAWLHKLLIGKKVSPYMTVCSLHFTQEDYIYPNLNRNKKKTLKKNAVPSVNLPQRSHMPKPTKERRVINKICSDKRLCADEEATTEAAENLLFLSELDLPSCSSSQDQDAEIIMDVDRSADLLVEFKDVGVQVTSGNFKPSFSSLIDSDIKLCKLTGLPNLKLLDFLEKRCEQHPNTKRSINLSLRDKIILTLIKLKHNLPNTILSLLFNTMTEATCGNYINEMLPVLCSILSVCIRWINHEENRINMPLCFQDFEDVICVLDCTEISVQKPKCLCCRTKRYSHYKRGHTVKFLVGVSPGGLFTFVSRAYDGRNSDKGIFNHEEFLEKCLAKDVTLVRPPFLGSKKKQFSPEEASLNAKIASARVHVERMFKSVKQFKILKDKLPSKLTPQVENIFKIICAIVNLSAPILADAKF